MNTVKRVRELAEERNLTLFGLTQLCGFSRGVFSNCEKRDGQLNLDTIERVCDVLGITLAEFFTESSPATGDAPG
ncbi:MAG: helix-turn-helix domain-containing protein [Faecousia sp.]